MTDKLRDKEKRVLKEMKDSMEYSCRALKEKIKMNAGECEAVLKTLMKQKYITRRQLTKYETRKYENGHTKFVYTKVTKE